MKRLTFKIGPSSARIAQHLTTSGGRVQVLGERYKCQIIFENPLDSREIGIKLILLILLTALNPIANSFIKLFREHNLYDLIK